jgi:hypothetical protein
MPTTAALVASVVLALLAVLQVAVARGAPWGRLVWGGQHEVLPVRLRIGSAVSVLLYAGFGLVLLDGAGVVALLPARVSAVAGWVLVGYFGLGVLVNAVSRSRAERLVMTPVCAVLAVCALVVASS